LLAKQFIIREKQILYQENTILHDSVKKLMKQNHMIIQC